MKVGQKVVCINDQFAPEVYRFYTALPKKDSVYTIREVKIGVNINGELGEVCLYLVGLSNPKSETPPFPERGFSSDRFRVIDELEQTEIEYVEKSDEIYA